jgi:hypothetical protein
MSAAVAFGSVRERGGVRREMSVIRYGAELT